MRPLRPRADLGTAALAAGAVAVEWVVVVGLTRADVASLALTGAATALVVLAANRFGGRIVAALAALAWIVGPAARPYWRADFRPVYRHDVLPVLYGLERRALLGVAVLLLAALVLALGRSVAERAAAVAFALAAVALAAAGPGLSPLAFHWHAFTTNLLQLREYGWSARVVEYLPLAGLVGAFRRSTLLGSLLGAWLVGAVVLPLGHARPHGFPTGMLEAVVAGIPAYAILVGCLVHLVPGWAAGPSAALGRPRLPQRQH